MTHEARLVGANAEQEIVGQFQSAAGWQVRQSAELDYGQKADLQVVCPGYAVHNVQVSAGPKSVGEQERLQRRGVQSLSLLTVTSAGIIAPEYACQNWCERELCPESIAPVEYTTPEPAPYTNFDHLYNGG